MYPSWPPTLNLCVTESRSTGIFPAASAANSSRCSGFHHFHLLFFLLPCGAERLRPLGIVSVNRHGLQPQLPRFNITFMMSSSVDSSGILIVLLIRRPKGTVAPPPSSSRGPSTRSNAPTAGRRQRAIEHRHVLFLSSNGARQSSRFYHVGSRFRWSVPGVYPPHQRLGHRVVTILITPPPTSFSSSPAPGPLDPVVSQSIMKPIVPVGASTVTCEFL